MEYMMAIDIGASSGRHILGSVENGKLNLEEIYRFENNYKNNDGSLCWDIDSLRDEVLKGIKHAKELEKAPSTIAIDTWGCDYVLLDEHKEILYPVYAYRDGRTAEVQAEAEQKMSFTDLYARTGIQKQNFNTVYQLFCDSKTGKLEKAKHFLMIPEFLTFVLTGEVVNEYTNATTTSMVNAETKQWDEEVLKAFDIPKEIFGELQTPGTKVGTFTKEIAEYAGFDAEVVLAPSHDTAAAVAACPLTENSAYISSGTWSLMGCELSEAIHNAESQSYNFTNEGGVEYRYRFLKNIMGTWILQNIRRELNKKYSFPEMIDMAKSSDHYVVFDVNDNSLLAPESMIGAVQNMMGEPKASLEDVLNSVYHSLGTAYGNTVREVESVTGKAIDQIIIVGGGSQDQYLNYMTAKYTNKPVVTGIKEATAIGTLIAQLLYKNNWNLNEARALIANTYELTEVKA